MYQNFLIFFFFTLQYCIGFAIHRHKSAMGKTRSFERSPLGWNQYSLFLSHE